MRKVIQLLGFVLALSLVAGMGTALAAWTEFDGHLYEAVVAPNGISWPDAEAAAEAEGGYLACITSAEENAFVFSLVQDGALWGVFWAGPWIGGYQDTQAADYSEPDGGWRWVSGETFADPTVPESGYTNWYNYPQAPDNGDIYHPAENFLDFFWKDTGGGAWNDLGTDTAPTGYVIEKVVPEPGSLLALGTGLLGVLFGAVRRRTS